MLVVSVAVRRQWSISSQECGQDRLEHAWRQIQQGQTGAWAVPQFANRNDIARSVFRLQGGPAVVKSVLGYYGLFDVVGVRCDNPF